MSRQPLRSLTDVLLVVLVVGSVILGGYVVMRDRAPVDDASSRRAAEWMATHTPDAGPLAVLVVGDSFTSGSDMNSGPTWATRLADKHGWTLLVDADGGTGYVNPGPTKAIPDRMSETFEQYAPDVVILASGHNDIFYPSGQVRAAAKRTVEAFKKAYPDATIEMFSPFSSGKPIPQDRRVGAVLRRVADEAGIAYLDVSDALVTPQKGVIGSDGTHPTDAGHLLLTERVGELIGEDALPTG